jgi:hypothetical protein
VTSRQGPAFTYEPRSSKKSHAATNLERVTNRTDSTPQRLACCHEHLSAFVLGQLRCKCRDAARATCEGRCVAGGSRLSDGRKPSKRKNSLVSAGIVAKQGLLIRKRGATTASHEQTETLLTITCSSSTGISRPRKCQIVQINASHKRTSLEVLFPNRALTTLLSQSKLAASKCSTSNPSGIRLRTWQDVMCLLEFSGEIANYNVDVEL